MAKDQEKKEDKKEREVVIIKSGGEPVAVIDNVEEKVKETTEMIKALWGEKVTIKVVKIKNQ